MWNDNRRHSTKRVKMRPKTSELVSRNSQYFFRSQLNGSAKIFLVVSVISMCILQLTLPGHCTETVNPTKVSNENSKLAVEIPKSSNHNDDADVVGYGEDCSSEGPFCDESRHLACDPTEEVCVCDTKRGYVHINDVPGGMEQHLLVQQDENGNSYVDLNGNVCLSKQEIIERTELLLGLWNKDDKKDPSSNVKSFSETDSFFTEYDTEEVEMLIDGQENDDILPLPSPPPAENNVRGRSKIYDEFMKTANIKQPEFNEERLKRFTLSENIGNAGLSEKDLIVEEILKYRMGSTGFDDLQPYLMNMLHIHMQWRNRKLSNSICSRIFDIDQDKLFTHQEYVISILSESIRELVVPKVFLGLIQPLVEESCISMEDLQALEHEPATLLEDFLEMDTNRDNCFSLEEFWRYANKTCWVNWFTDILKDVDLDFILLLLDPSPEEMFIRRIMHNERLGANWKMIDKNKDGYISKNELQSDFTPSAFSSENDHVEADELLKHFDKNKDDKISMDEVKLQISVPHITEEYQLEWLESLYELYETDEEEVKEYLEAFNENYLEHVGEKANDTEPSQEKGIHRIFTIFDKNRNGEMDKVEFKLLMELMKKYVVHDILNETIDSMDLDSNRKLSIFEYEEFLKNSSDNLGTFLLNLLALEEQVEEIENGGTSANVDADDYYNPEEDETEADANSDTPTPTVSSTKLSNRAAASNLTLMIRKLFSRMDENGDGFITKEDFYSHTISHDFQRTESEMRQEFSQLDIDKDGVLTTKDSENYVIPIDFEKFKETSAAFSEEVFSSHLEEEFPLIDKNWDGIIQKEEFIEGREILFQSYEDDMFLEWIEHYLGAVPNQLDRASEKTFAEFDANCDKYLSENEFQVKLDELRSKMDETVNSLELLEEASLYFKALDLNKDGKVSQNEFQLLLLRTGKKLHVL